MMLPLSNPICLNRTIYRGTDHRWLFRRVDEDGTPIVPDSAEAEIRGKFGGDLWASFTISIDPVDGWVAVELPEADTTGSEWDHRKKGVWDLEVVVAGDRLRWVMGDITVSQDVTRP